MISESPPLFFVVPAARVHMLNALFPAHASIKKRSNPVPVPPEHAGTLGEPLCKAMCSSNAALRHYSNELAWFLCEKDPDTFTRLVGWGTAVVTKIIYICICM